MGVKTKTKNIVTFKSAWDAWLLINQVLPNPDPVLRKRGGGIRIYRDLMGDPHVAACLRSRKSGVLAREWELERDRCPARVFKSVHDWFEKLDLREILDGVLDVVFWGYQPVEISWGLDGGMWLPTQVAPKPPEWFAWTLTEDGIPELRFLSKRQPISGEPIEDRFALVCPRVSPSFENPYGRGVAGLCFWPVVFKKAGIEFWTNFAERFGQPWVVGTSETPVDEEKFLEQLQNLVQDAVVALSKGKAVELLSEGGKAASAEVFERYCRFMDNAISKAVLSQTLSTELPESGGSYAATKGHLDVREDVIEADEWLARTFLQHLVQLVIERNGYTVPAPKVKIYEEEDPRKEWAERDDILTRTGLKFLKPHYARCYNLQEDEFEVVGVPSESQPPGEEDQAQAKLKQFAERRRHPLVDFPEIRRSIAGLDELTLRGMEMAQPHLDAMLEQVLLIADEVQADTTIDDKQKYSEFMVRVREFMRTAGAQQWADIADLLANARFQAHVWGAGTA